MQLPMAMLSIAFHIGFHGERAALPIVSHPLLVFAATVAPPTSRAPVAAASPSVKAAFSLSCELREGAAACVREWRWDVFGGSSVDTEVTCFVPTLSGSLEMPTNVNKLRVAIMREKTIMRKRWGGDCSEC